MLKLFAAGAATAALAACAAPTPTPAPTKEPEAKPTPVPPTPKPAPKTPAKVTYGTWGDPNFLRPIDADIKAFNESQQDYVVERLAVAGSDKEPILVLFAAGAGPDCYFALDTTAREFAVKGVCAELDEYLSKVGGTRDRWLPQFVNTYIVKGKLYGVPQAFGADSNTFINLDLFQKEGLESPIDTEKAGKWTWDVLRDEARKLTKLDANGNPTQFGFEWSGDWSWYFPAMLAEGGSYFDAAQNKFLGAEEAAVRGIQMWADIRNVDKSTPIPIPGQAMPSTLSFPGGGVGLSQHGFWYIGMLLFGQVPFKWDIVLPPKGSKTRGCTGGTAAICVHSQSKVKEGAFNFAWYRNQEGPQLAQLAMVSDFSPVTGLNARITEVNKSPINWSAASGISEFFVQRPYRAGLDEVFSKYIQPALDRVTQGKATAAEAMGGIAQKVDEELAKLTDVL
jgi:ABC-type glycerol-3-phosphate transport system substrate-binding protein